MDGASGGLWDGRMGCVIVEILVAHGDIRVVLGCAHLGLLNCPTSQSLAPSPDTRRLMWTISASSVAPPFWATRATTASKARE